jgi:hypothetical protein
MYFKRPSFRRGGNIGGGIMSGTDMGTRTGFQNPMIDFLNRNILGRNTQIGTTPLSNVSQSVGIEELLKGTDTRGSFNTTPQTVEELYKRRGEKLKRSGDYIGSLIDNTYRDKEGNLRDITTGEIITDTTTSTSSGIAEIVSDGPAGDQITMLSDEAKGAATEALLKSIEEKKKRVEPGSDDSSITLDPYEEIKKEKDFLSEMLKNEGLERGEIALIAAKAIGTEGSFKDKLDAAVALALPVVRRRNKEDKALTLTAYKAFKEKEAAQAKAGQDTTGIKDLKYQADILRKSGDPQYKNKSQEEVISIIIKDKFGDADSNTRKKNLSDKTVVGEIYDRYSSVKDAKTQLDLYIEEKYTKKNKTIDTADKKLLRYQKALEEAKKDFNLFTSIPEFGDIHPNILDAYERLGVKDGGRIKRALGSPSTGEQIITTEAQTIGAETAEKPVLKLDYAQLRDRLPPEITDDVVQLLANSEEALQEFAYIQTQNDVDAFNLKYGVNLIIPPAPQTA